jgi:hypothetical protein
MGLGYGDGFSNKGASLYLGYGLLNGIELNVQDITFGIDYHPMIRIRVKSSSGGGTYSNQFGFSVKYRY